jgi:two-component system cell cycle response regulator
MKTNVAFDDSFSRAGQLPTLPGIALKLLEAVQKDEPNLEEIGNIISKDPPLSAEVLKIINSSFYSLPTKITSVFHAINLLGIHTVKNLALSFSLIKNNRNTDLDGFNYTLFWKDSLIGAVATQLLAENIKANLAEDAFFLGLLHNIGILTMMQCLPKQYNLVIKEMETTGYTYHEAENAILGFNHMAVGEYLVKSWKLPETFYVPIAHHHTPEKLTTERSDIEMLTRILHLSALYIDLFNLPDKSLNLAQIEIFSQSYGFAGKIDIDEIGLKINKYTQDIFPLFEIDIGEENDYTEILEAARKELIDLSTDFMATLLNQRQELELLRRQITKDGMTQLNNYQHFYELLHQEIYRAQRYTLLLPVTTLLER